MILGVLALAGIAGAWGYASIQNKASQEVAAVSPPPMMNVAALGQIEPHSYVINVASGTPDRLKSLLVQRGDVVKEGQILGYLQSYAMEVAQRNQLAAQLTAAKLKLSTKSSLGQVKIENAQIRLKTVNAVYPPRIAAQEATVVGLEVMLKNNQDILKAYQHLLNTNASSQRIPRQPVRAGRARQGQSRHHQGASGRIESAVRSRPCRPKSQISLGQIYAGAFLKRNWPSSHSSSRSHCRTSAFAAPPSMLRSMDEF